MKQKNIYILVIFILVIILTFVLKTSFKESESATGNKNVIKLVNVAKKYSIIADGTGDTSFLTDGNPSTRWLTNNEKWPATLTMALPPKGIIVDELVIRFLQEPEYPRRSLNLNIQYEIAGKEEMETIEETDFKFFSKEYSYVFPENSLISKIIITLSNPKDSGVLGKFWPALEEIEIYSPKN